ncbi:MAG: hypothetical protein RIQ89_914 [Bacteroidota bacterium]
MNKKIYFFTIILSLLQAVAFHTSAQNIAAGEPVQVVGQFNGYTTTPYGGDYRTTAYRRVSLNAGTPTDGRGQWKTTINVQSSGGDVTPINMAGGPGNGFLFISGPIANRFQNKWTFGGVGSGAINALNNTTYFTVGGQDMGLNMSSTGYYTFVMKDAGYNNNAAPNNQNYYVGYTSSNPVSITHTGAPQRTVNSDGSVNIEFTTSATPSVQENFYIRYRSSTNDFSIGTNLVQASMIGTNGTATIPVQVGAATVYYYIFSSTRTLAQLNTDAEHERSIAHLNYQDNSGNNFSYANSILVTGTFPGPTSALYASLTIANDAFTSINNGTHRGTVAITVLADVATETGATPLYQSGFAGTSNYTTITMQPSGNRTLSGSSATMLIDLNGCDFVTINGLNDGTNSLNIFNNNASATNGTIRFISDARNNTITNCTLRGQSTGVNAAVIQLSTANGTTQLGNDNNQIINNIIREVTLGNEPRWGIVSLGSSTPASALNSNITVSGNQFQNCFFIGVASGTDISGGIHLTSASNSDWTIDDNDFFVTTSKTTNVSFDYWYGIRITGGNGQGFIITNNNFGGTSINCGGSPFNFTNSSNGNKVVGINVNTASTGTPTSIQGNRVGNFVINTNSSKLTSPYLFSGINVEAGLVNIGTVTGNTIGSTTGSSGVTVSVNTNAGGLAAGIATSGAGTIVIQNNTVATISVQNPSSSNTRVSFHGIYINGGGATVSNNVIGLAAFATSINNTSGNTATTAAHTVGISGTSSAASSVTITNNQINNIVFNSGNTLGQAIGIWTNGRTNTITGNIINNVRNTAPNIGTGSGSAVIGILTQGLTSNGDIISQNQIINLAATNTASTTINGILVLNSSNAGTHTIARNLIYGCNSSSTSTSSFIHLININVGSLNVNNNMLCAGTEFTTPATINGIILNGGTSLIYHNSIAITNSCSNASTIANGISFVSTNAGTSALNNIIVNNRALGTATNARALHFISGTQLSNVATCNYNDLFVGSGSQIGNVGGVGYTTLATWQGTTRDLNSVNLLPTFANISNDLHITGGCELAKRGLYNITIDYDGATRTDPPDIGADEFSISPTSVSWTGATNTNWHVNTNWCPAVVPTSLIDAIIPNTAVPNQPLIDVGGNAVCKSLTIGTGKTLTMQSSRLLQIYGALFTNNGTFNGGVSAETVEFMNAVTINGSSATTFNNATINNSTTLSTIPTIRSVFTLNSGSFVNTAPIYGASSRLNYNTGGAYNVNAEWVGATIVAGLGNPNDVSIANTTTLNMPNTARGLAGSMLIYSGTLQMNGALGADVYVGRDWERVNGSGYFNPNNRAVWFRGSVDQVVRVTGNGTETFNYLIIDKPTATYLRPSNLGGELTNITVNGMSGDIFQLINTGTLDINSRIFTLEGNDAVATAGVIYVNNARTITNTGGILNGLFAITGTNNPNQPNYYVKGVRNNGGIGTLTFDQNVVVTIADGHMDFGFDGTNNITTIQGVLQVNLGGNVFPNSCYFSGPTPPSTLRFANTVDYQVSATDKTWAAGAIYSGLPGIPWNVDVNNNGTDLTINDQRSLRNNLTITDGTMTLNAGPFNIGGNWKRTGITSAFVPKTYRVVFDKTGVGNQTIECNNNGNRETYYELELSPATVNVQSFNNTDVSVTNQLIFTSGLYITGTNEIYITNPISTSITGHAVNRYVWGNLKRKIGTTLTSYDFPVGNAPTEQGYELANITYTTAPSSNYTVKANFNAWPTCSFATCASCIPPNGPVSNECLYANYNLFPAFNHGYWTMNVDSGSSTGIYTASLFNRNYCNNGGSLAWSIMKRSPSGAGAWALDGVCNAASTAAQSIRDNMSGFSDFATVQFNSPLPIELLSFEVEKQDPTTALVSWTTVSEINNDYFIVESASALELANGNGYTELGMIDGAGNSNTKLHYQLLDDRVGKQGLHYYRLKQVDFDGRFTYSDVKVVNFSSKKLLLLLGAVPNPFNQSTQIYVSSYTAGPAAFLITDAAGKTIVSKQVNLESGINILGAEQSLHLSAGVYFVTIAQNGENVHCKIIKQ